MSGYRQPRRQSQTPRYYREQQNIDDIFPPPPRNSPQGYGQQQGYGTSMKPGNQVEVRVRGNFWVIGLLVSGLHFVASAIGQGYDVEYSDNSNRVIRSTFSPEDIRPYGA